MPRIRTEILINGVWVDISVHVLDRQELVISWGRKDEASRVTHTKVAPQINNRDGQYSDDNPYSPYFGQLAENTRIRQSVQLPDGTWSFRFHCEIPAWPQRWDLSGRDVYVPVQAAGILRRLGQSTKPLRDALRRYIAANGALAHWPLTDGESAREGSEIVQGAQPMRAIGESGSFFQGQPNWGKGSLAPWLDAVVELPDNTVGRIRARVPKHDITSWAVDHYLTSSGGEGGVLNLTVLDAGAGSDADPSRSWDVGIDREFDQIQLRVFERGETTSSNTLLDTLNSAGVADGSPHMIRLALTDTGAGSTDWAVIVDGVTRSSGTHAVQNQAVSLITYRWNLEDATVPGGTITAEAMALGHITYWGTVPPAADTYRAFQGHVRELAGRRIERLCTEQGVPLAVNGNLDQTPPMGPQKPAKFLDILDTAAKVDGGVVHEARDAFALAYRTNRSRYNQGG